MSAYIKYKIKSVKVNLIVIYILNLLFLIGVIPMASFREGVNGSTYFRAALIEAKGNVDVWLCVAVVTLGINIMYKCHSSAEKSLPLKNKSRYFASYLIGAGTIIIQWLMVTIASIIHYIRYSDIYHEWNLTSSYYDILVKEDSLASGVIYLAEIYLIILCIYTVCALCMIASKSKFTALITAVEMALFPYYILITVRNIADKYFSINNSINVEIILEKIVYKYIGILDSHIGYLWYQRDMDLQVYYLENVVELCKGMSGIIVLCIFIGVIIAIKSDGASGKIMLSSCLDKLFALITAIYIAFFIPHMVYVKNVSFVTLLIVEVIAISLAYYIIMKFISSGRKYNYLNKKRGIKDENK